MDEPRQPRRHGLRGYHVQFIAIGGAIGAGLFVGSSESINLAGPSIILAYALCGAFIFLVARALGELALKHPVAGGFSTYAATYIGPRAGFVTGWSYWLNWVMVVIAEITAVSLLVRFWLPDLPQWVPSLIVLVSIWGLNMVQARAFGNLEMAICLIKVVTILALIGLGTYAILIGHASSSGPVALSNIWSHGGIFPKGFGGFAQAMPIIIFAFGGVEIIGVAAAEVEAPEKALPRAINSIVGRILLFYVGSMVVIMALIPWPNIPVGSSPFVLAFSALGVSGAAQVVNIVVLTAVISSCNAGVFATGRVLHGLALAHQAPSIFRSLSNQEIPGTAITASALCMCVGVLLNYVTPSEVFGFVMRLDAILMLWIWFTIVWAHRAYRRTIGVDAHRALSFRLPGAPATNWIAIAFIAFVAAFNLTSLRSASILLLALAWFGSLMLVHRFVESREPHSTPVPTS